MRRAALYICYSHWYRRRSGELRELAHCGLEIRLLTFEKERLTRSHCLSIRERLLREDIQ